MKVLFVASEAFPLAKVGGLADVTSSLAIALRELGHEPCLILPKYASIRARAQDIEKGNIAVSFEGHSQQATLKLTRLKDRVPVYLVENSQHFGTEEIYTQDELTRFLFFSLCIPAIISHLDLHPDLVHCHDWHTALVPLWLKTINMKLPCMFTIHNLAYQGFFDHKFFSTLDFPQYGNDTSRLTLHDHS